MKTIRSQNSKSGRPRLPEVSEEMKAWSAALVNEAADWPEVSVRPFFGFSALYRGKRIFGLLPRTRAMETPNSLAFKLESPKGSVLSQLRRDPRVIATEMRKARWFTFELGSASDIRDALFWLERANQAAAKVAGSRAK